jgi:hypothetical protein
MTLVSLTSSVAGAVVTGGVGWPSAHFRAIRQPALHVPDVLSLFSVQHFSFKAIRSRHLQNLLSHLSCLRDLLRPN